MTWINQNAISRSAPHKCEPPAWPDKPVGTRGVALPDFDSDIGEGSMWRCDCGQYWVCVKSGRYTHGTNPFKLRRPKWKKDNA